VSSSVEGVAKCLGLDASAVFKLEWAKDQAPKGRACDKNHLPHHPPHFKFSFADVNSVSVLALKILHRIPFDLSELSISEITPTFSPKVRPVAILE
jgi:hypothetical protein